MRRRKRVREIREVIRRLEADMMWCVGIELCALAEDIFFDLKLQSYHDVLMRSDSHREGCPGSQQCIHYVLGRVLGLIAIESHKFLAKSMQGWAGTRL